MKAHALGVIVLLAFTASATAQWRSRDGEILPDTPAMKHRGTLAAMLQIATEDAYTVFEHEWHNTPAAHTPSLKTTGMAARGDSVRVLVVYSGCAAATTGDQPRCDATLHLRVTKPDGETYADLPGFSLAQGAPALQGVVQLSPHSLLIHFEPDDPLGRYRVQAAIHDPTQHVTLELMETIRLKEAQN